MELATERLHVYSRNTVHITCTSSLLQVMNIIYISGIIGDQVKPQLRLKPATRVEPLLQMRLKLKSLS